MIVVVCPHPPLLVPALDPRALAELVPVREAALAAVRTILDARPGTVTVLGAGAGDVDVDERAGGSLRGYGADVAVGGPDPVLPLSLTVGAWLLDEAGWRGPRRHVGDGVDLTSGPPPEALLVMADGSTRRTDRSPGSFDERAEGFDALVSAVLADGDAAALAGLDLDLADDLKAAGARALVQAGRLVASLTDDGAEVRARLHLETAPFGVGYWVADWQVGTTPPE